MRHVGPERIVQLLNAVLASEDFLFSLDDDGDDAMETVSQCFTWMN
jgi:hypothetical protein